MIDADNAVNRRFKQRAQMRLAEGRQCGAFGRLPSRAARGCEIDVHLARSQDRTTDNGRSGNELKISAIPEGNLLFCQF